MLSAWWCDDSPAVGGWLEIPISFKDIVDEGMRHKMTSRLSTMCCQPPAGVTASYYWKEPRLRLYLPVVCWPGLIRFGFVRWLHRHRHMYPAQQIKLHHLKRSGIHHQSWTECTVNGCPLTWIQFPKPVDFFWVNSTGKSIEIFTSIV